MTTSKKKRKCLLACARKGMNLSRVNSRLIEECLDKVHEQEWALWENYYLNFVRDDPYLEYELIDNDRSLAWLVQAINRRKNKLIIS